MIRTHHHHPSAAEQAITSFLQAHRSLARVAISSAAFPFSSYPTHVGCRQDNMCVDVQVSFCHEMVCREHIFLQVLPLGVEEYAQENLAGAFLHSGQEARCWSWYIWCWRHGLSVWYPAWPCSKRLQRNWFCSPYLVTVPRTHSHKGEWSHRWRRIDQNYLTKRRQLFLRNVDAILKEVSVKQ